MQVLIISCFFHNNNRDSNVPRVTTTYTRLRGYFDERFAIALFFVEAFFSQWRQFLKESWHYCHICHDVNVANCLCYHEVETVKETHLRHVATWNIDCLLIMLFIVLFHAIFWMSHSLENFKHICGTWCENVCGHWQIIITVVYYSRL